MTGGLQEVCIGWDFIRENCGNGCDVMLQCLTLDWISAAVFVASESVRWSWGWGWGLLKSNPLPVQSKSSQGVIMKLLIWQQGMLNVTAKVGIIFLVFEGIEIGPALWSWRKNNPSGGMRQVMRRYHYGNLHYRGSDPCCEWNNKTGAQATSRPQQIIVTTADGACVCWLKPTAEHQ